MYNIAVIGASGAIGGALTEHLAYLHPGAMLTAFSRSHTTFADPRINSRILDYENETEIASAAVLASERGPLDLYHQGDSKHLMLSPRSLILTHLRSMFIVEF